MTALDDWPSLGHEIELARALFGSPDRVSAWLSQELSRTEDDEFARSFSDHIDLPGVRHRDYLHRLIDTARGHVLGGIRFRGRDISKPFVEIIAHTFDDTAALTECVAREWEIFSPKALRVRLPPAAGHLLDQTVHIARCADMLPPVPEVRLAPFDHVEDALDTVRIRYRELDPELAHRVSAASRDDLRSWHDTGRLHAIEADRTVVGALAVVPADILWIDGAVVHEEVIAAEHAGHHYASKAQRRWAADNPNPDELLIGTIDGLNVASRRAAEAAGRTRLLDLVFVPLG
ncbi:hypothetical protein [Mycobacterium sp. C31M]